MTTPPSHRLCDIRATLSPADFYEYQRRAIRHCLEHPRSMLWLDMALGKLQPLTEPVMTPDGWVPMMWINKGDYVIGGDGRPTQVLATFDHTHKPIYKVTMTDGSWTLCGAEHLWAVRKPAAKLRGSPYKVLSTQEILAGGLRDGAGNLKWHVPIVEAVELPEQKLPIEPYMLGVILGDGTITQHGRVVVCSDTEIVSQWEGSERLHDTSDYTSYKTLKGLNQALKDLDLAGKRSWEKHVPYQYLKGSIFQRWSLLQGLLDTDAYPIPGNGGAEFSTTSKMLADAVVELAQSLGGTGRKSAPRRTKFQDGTGRVSWRVNVKLPAAFPPFRLQRKLAKWGISKSRDVARLITSIEPHSVQDARCIMVANPDGLYVTRSYIVTHNTACVLTVIQHLINNLKTYRALVLAPRRVAETVWRQEARKWTHTAQDLRVVLIRGSKEEMRRQLHDPRANVHVINYEAVPWLVKTVNQDYLSKGRYPPWSMVVFDEIDRFKNASGKRYQMFEPLLPYFSHRIGMTGTPADNGYPDLHGQYKVVDDGARLYKHVGDFRTQWCRELAHGWELRADAKTQIERRIQDITLSMSADDYLKLPDYQYHDVWVDLEPKVQRAYDKLETELFAQLERHDEDPLDGDWELEVTTAVGARTKCRQFANGAILLPDVVGDPTRCTATPVHDAKIEALDSIVHEAAGRPILVAYTFRADMERLIARYTKQGYRVGFIGPGTKDIVDVIGKWNAGYYHILTAHPASAGHGLNLQAGGHEIVWLGLTDNLRYYRQFNARLRRLGQSAPNVHIRRILARRTVDEPIAELLESKTATAEELRRAVERYRQTKR